MSWQKRMADGLTLARVPLALAVVGVGFGLRAEGAQAALSLLLVAATCDTLDGYFARLSPDKGQTWVGAHDVGFDLAFSTSLLIFLAVAGFVPWALATPYFLLWMAVFVRSHAVPNAYAVLFQAPLYLGVVYVAARRNAYVLAGIAGWLAVILLFAWRRFFRVRVPGFFDDLHQHLSGVQGRNKAP